MKRKYYKRYDNMPEPLLPEIIEKPPNIINKFKNFQFEDIIIIALIILMLTEEEPDYLTIGALGFIFFA